MKKPERSAQSSDGLKHRTDLHLARKAYHIIGVTFILGLYQVLTRDQGLKALAVSMAIVIFADLVRLRVSSVNRVFLSWFKPFLRKEEAHKVSGMSHLLAGCFVIVALFPKEIVNLALLYLAFGDPLSSVVGILYGKDKFLPNKSLQGTLAGFFVCALISGLYLGLNDIMAERLLLVSILGGFIGTFSEMVSLGKMDDNFTIPVLSSGFLWILFRAFGGF